MPWAFFFFFRIVVIFPGADLKKNIQVGPFSRPSSDPMCSISSLCLAITTKKSILTANTSQQTNLHKDFVRISKCGTKENGLKHILGLFLQFWGRKKSIGESNNLTWIPWIPSKRLLPRKGWGKKSVLQWKTWNPRFHFVGNNAGVRSKNIFVQTMVRICINQLTFVKCWIKTKVLSSSLEKTKGTLESKSSLLPLRELSEYIFCSL